jgi:hypothetical protein
MIDRDIKLFILKALLAAKKAVTHDWLKGAVRSAFMHVTLTDGDLKQYITECESAGWIAGTKDELLGVMWSLTPDGKIKAQQL